MTDPPQDALPPSVRCPAASEPSVRLFIVAGVLLVVAFWCFMDRHKYPRPPAWTAEHFGAAAGHILNNYGPILFAPLGVLLIVLGIRSRKRVLIADADGIGYVGKPTAPWSDVTGLDASRLEKDQVLDLLLASGGKLRLDSYKLANFRALVAFVEAKVAPESAYETSEPPENPPAGS